MFPNVKTNYIFSSTDVPTADKNKKARMAIESVQDAVRVSKMLGVPDIGSSVPSETEVVQAVTEYLSEPKFAEARFTTDQECEIPVGDDRYRVDVALLDADGRFAAIAECKLPEDSDYDLEPLKNFIEATDVLFGIFASGVGRDTWHFCEKLHQNQFRLIEQSDFETKILESFKVRRIGEPE